jgi:hypothetical protein
MVIGMTGMLWPDRLMVGTGAAAGGGGGVAGAAASGCCADAAHARSRGTMRMMLRVWVTAKK